MRVQGDPNPSNNGIFYFLTDHLGSTTVTVDADGEPVGERSDAVPHRERCPAPAPHKQREQPHLADDGAGQPPPCPSWPGSIRRPA